MGRKRINKQAMQESASVTIAMAGTPNMGILDQNDPAIAALLNELDANPVAVKQVEQPVVNDESRRITDPDADMLKVVEQPVIQQETAEVESELAVEEASKEETPKKTPKKRVSYADRTDRIIAGLGEKKRDYLVLTTDIGMLNDTQIDAEVEKVVEDMRKLGEKVKNRVDALLEFVSERKGDMNEPAQAAYRVLCRDQKITTGDNGNLHKELTGGSDPFRQSSARAMGRNTINAMAFLQMIKLTEKGEYVRNDASLLLMKVDMIMNARKGNVEVVATKGEPAPEVKNEEIEEPIAVAA